jgi:ribose-phosphate pyrophosphokinase
MISKERKVAN